MSLPRKTEGSQSSENAETKLAHYRALVVSLREDTPDDVDRQLPGLVDAVVSASTEHPETARFRIGVSVTGNQSLFDYFLKREPHPDAADPRVKTVKAPVSHDQRYLQFTYPPDPAFDAAVLRGVLLATLDDRIRDLEEQGSDGSGSRFSGVWGLLSDSSADD